MRDKNRTDTAGKTPARQIVVFYLAALIASWAIWAPWVLTVQGVLQMPASRTLHLAGSLGPALAALLVLVWTGGRAAVRQLARRTFIAAIGLAHSLRRLTVPAHDFRCGVKCWQPGDRTSA